MAFCLRLVPRPDWLIWIAAVQAFVVRSGCAGDPVVVLQGVCDAIFSSVNDADSMRKALFSLSGITTGMTCIFMPPNTSGELTPPGHPDFSGNKTFTGTLLASVTVKVSAASTSLGTTTGLTKTVNLGTGGASGSATTGAGGTRVVNTPKVTPTFSVARTQALYRQVVRNRVAIGSRPIPNGHDRTLTSRLSGAAQWYLLSISRPSSYGGSWGESALNLDLMLLIDKRLPFAVQCKTMHLRLYRSASEVATEAARTVPSTSRSPESQRP